MKDLEKYQRYAKRIPLFNGISPEEVSDILHKGQVLYFPQGKTIFHKGQCGNNLFVVFSGAVDILNGDHRIGQCRVGDAFGEMSVLDHRPHTATAMAATEVKLFTLDETQINEILHQRVAVRFLLNIIHLLSGHLADTNALLTQVEFKLWQYEHPQARPSSRLADPATPLDTPTGR
jgi:CRP-like cAMP-binding protein